MTGAPVTVTLPCCGLRTDRAECVGTVLLTCPDCGVDHALDQDGEQWHVEPLVVSWAAGGVK